MGWNRSAALAVVCLAFAGLAACGDNLKPNLDLDDDGIFDDVDNCPDVSNPAQEDRDADHVGDVCDACPDDATNAGGCGENPEDQTITFTSTAPVGAVVAGATYTVTATASSGLPVAFTIDASASAVCTIAGATVSFVGAGDCVIDANQAGSADFNAAPQVQQTFAVGRGAQTITFTSTAPANATPGGAAYAVTATATSGLPVTFTIDASASSICTFAGGTVSFIGVGDCVINADQPGDANYTAAPQVQQTFAVGRAAQTITFTSTAPAAAAVSGATYTVTAIASSGLPVSFAIDASASAVCTLAGATVSFIGAGTCVINANQAGDATFQPAPQVQQAFTVGRGAQTITFTSTAPAAAAVGDAPYTVTATASSGLPVSFTIDASAASVCTIAGAAVSFVGAGTCVINADQAGDTNFLPATQVQQSFTVGRGAQSIAFTSTAPAAAAVGGATYTVTATASSGLPVSFTIDASASAVCTIAGATVSFIGAGTCVIDADQAGDANFLPAAQVQQSFAVGRGGQVILFTSSPPVGALVGDAPYTVTATASSGLPVTFTIDASASAVCTIAGAAVSFVGAGTCVINADQAGDANFQPATQAQQSFFVGRGGQTITFTSTAPTAATVGGATYTVTATSSSGLPVALTIDASAGTVCTIAGPTVSFIGAGTCLIDANQAGNADFEAAAQVQQTFTVGAGAQTITFTSTAPAAATVGGATYSVTATASSGLPVALTIDASASGVCTIAGSTVSFIGAGSCVIDANQAGDANYGAAPQVQQTFNVGRGAQTITFTSTAPASATVDGPTYTATATATSGLPVALTINPLASGVCTITGSTVSFIGAGTCVIDANQPGDANYNAAPQAQQTFSVGRGAQTIAFTSTAPAAATVGGATYTVTATASSGLPVTFTIDPLAAGVCTIAGSTVSFIGNGTCVIDANQGGNANYNAAPQIQQTFGVGRGNQTIAFTSTAPAAATVGGATYTVTATATSGLAVTFTVDASASSVCTIAGSTVSFVGAGSCVINANQAGNANYNAASQVQQTFNVGAGAQTIAFTSTAPSAATVGGATYTVTATATSGLPVAFTIDASASSVCTIAGSTVSFVGAGSCVIDANQAGNANYNAAPQVQQTFSVGAGAQTIIFTSLTPGAATVGGATYTVTATATSGLPITFTIDALASGVCTIAGSTVSFVGAGTCVINANQAGNANYNPAPQVQQSFAVARANQTITFTSTAPVAATVGGPTYAVTATASSGLAVTFAIDPLASGVCTIAGATVSFIGQGTCVINANQAGNANYNAAPQVQQTFAVSRQTQTITYTSTAPAAATVGGTTYTVTATASSGLAVTFSVDASASGACAIAGSTVTFVTSGTCVINANQAGNATYDPAPQAQQSFAVARANQTITFTSTPPAAAVIGGTYTVTATASSGLTVTFAIDASASAICSLSGAIVTFNTTGTCVINANQAGDISYNAAPQAQQSFTVGPALAADTYAVVGNTQLVADGHSTPTTPHTIDSASVLDNDSGGTVAVTAATNAVTTGNGRITINAAGAFTYTPPVGASSGTDTYLYTATSGGVSRTATITFNISNIVWYVNNTASGTRDGRSNTPFSGLGVGAGNLGASAAAGAYIYVARGVGNTAGAHTLLANQRLIGAGATLSVGGLLVAGNAADPPILAGTLSATGVAGVVVNGVRMSTGTSIAVNLVNTDGQFTFRRIDASGGANAIVWNNATAALPTSSFTITGDGANTAQGGNGSGGVMSGMVGADGAIAGSAIYLNNVGNVVLRRVSINGNMANYAIRGLRVNGFTLEYSNIDGNYGTAASLAAPNTAGEGAIYFGDTATNGLSTSGTFTSNIIAGGRGRNLSIINTTAGTTSLSFRSNQFGLTQNFADAGHSLAVEARGAAVINTVIGGTVAEANTFAGTPGDQVNITGQAGTLMDVQLRSNTMQNVHPSNLAGGGGLTLSTQGTMTFNVDGNSLRGANGNAITLEKASAGALLSGRVTSNTIGQAGVPLSCSGAGSGLFLSAAGTGTVTLAVLDNQIRNCSAMGLYLDNTDGSYTVNLTVQGNVIAQAATASALMALSNGGPSSSDTINVCAVLGGATATQRNTFTAPFGVDVFLGASGAAAGHTFNLPGYVGSNPGNVQTFVSGNNSIGGGASYFAYTDVGVPASAFTGSGTSCPLPP
ncbi:MAG TPA: hypothetical protein VM261_25690 [Kofleriaceae bacterium]|nr:hypothetical protein [Kofleriaceae bacterium]